MFIRKYWIPLSVLLIAIAAVSVYWTQTRPPKELTVIYKPVEPLPKSERQTEAPVVSEAPQGHVHADPHEIPSDETIESDAEFKARVEKNAAKMAAAKTALERNAAIMRRMETSPYFEIFPHLFEDMYNFYKAHPDFDHETASPELNQKWVDAVYAQHAKMSAHAEQMDAQYVPLVEVDKRPRIYTPNGTIWLDEGGNR